MVFVAQFTKEELRQGIATLVQDPLSAASLPSTNAFANDAKDALHGPLAELFSRKERTELERARADHRRAHRKDRIAAGVYAVGLAAVYLLPTPTHMMVAVALSIAGFRHTFADEVRDVSVERLQKLMNAHAAFERAYENTPPIVVKYALRSALEKR